MQARVYYEDTDAGGVVYHTNYIKYCERARSDLFFQKGVTPSIQDCHFVVSSLCCKFIKSAKLGDLLDVDATITEMKSASMSVHQNIFLGSQKIFEMDLKLGFVDTSGNIRKIPQELRDILQAVAI